MKYFDSQFIYIYIVFIFNIFNIVTCNKQQYFKNSTLKKTKSENDLRIYQNKYSKKNKLYRTDNSYVYHLIKDNDYHMNDFIKYKNIDYFYKNHQIPINSYSVNSSPISSPPVEKKIIDNIDYYNEFYHDF